MEKNMPKVATSGINDLKTLYPTLVLDWDYDINEKNPEDYLPHSKYKAAWRCHKCGYKWNAYIYSRTVGNGCPACAGQVLIVGKNDLKTRAPELACQWDYKKNGDLKPEDVMLNSSKPVYWKCSKGHSWKVSPNSRVSQHTGCKKCSSELRTSFAEQSILFYVRKYVEAENRFIFKGREIDIYIPSLKIGIEYDGIYYHSGDAAAIREEKKNILCAKNGIDLLRIKEVRKESHINSMTDKVFYRYVESEKYLKEAIEWILRFICTKGGYRNDVLVDLDRDRNKIRELYIKNDKENSLQKKYPNIASDWDYEKNNGLKPVDVVCGSNKKVYWKCHNCGYEWMTSVNKRTQRQTKCKKCRR